MWQTGAVNWEQTTVMFKVSFQYGSCQTMSLSIIQYKLLTVFFMQGSLSPHIWRREGRRGISFPVIHTSHQFAFFFLSFTAFLPL